MPSYRCHGYPIVLGTSLRKMMAEVFGRKDGLCKGFGGSMHLADPATPFSRHLRNHRTEHRARHRRRADGAGEEDRPGGLLLLR